MKARAREICLGCIRVQLKKREKDYLVCVCVRYSNKSNQAIYHQHRIGFKSASIGWLVARLAGFDLMCVQFCPIRNNRKPPVFAFSPHRISSSSLESSSHCHFVCICPYKQGCTFSTIAHWQLFIELSCCALYCYRHQHGNCSHIHCTMLHNMDTTHTRI